MLRGKSDADGAHSAREFAKGWKARRTERGIGVARLSGLLKLGVSSGLGDRSCVAANFCAVESRI